MWSLCLTVPVIGRNCSHLCMCAELCGVRNVIQNSLSHVWEGILHGSSSPVYTLPILGNLYNLKV